MRVLLALALMAGPAAAEHVQITLIDARTLSAEQLMAMAAAERGSAVAHDCCEWGGLGCRVETVASLISTPDTLTPKD